MLVSMRFALKLVMCGAVALVPVVAVSTPAFADSCASVDATGVCIGGSTTVGGSTVAVGVPSETVTNPTTECVLVTCIPKGQVLLTTPAEGTSVPVPAETVPVGYAYTIANACITGTLSNVVFWDLLGPTGVVQAAENGDWNLVVAAGEYTVWDAAGTPTCVPE